MTPVPVRCGAAPRGIVLLAVLVAMALLSIGLMGAVDVWTVSRQRERERELLFVGDQYRQAIRSYYLAAPGGRPRGYPLSIDALLEDDRFPLPVRHLRRAYPDPITGKSEWGLLRVEDRILGVYSLSEAQPLKQAAFHPADQTFTNAESYKNWVFAYVPRRGTLVPSSTSASAPSSGTSGPMPTPPRRRSRS
ncbi:MAG: type II secretion system protein [Caldimonas sp.]